MPTPFYTRGPATARNVYSDTFEAPFSEVLQAEAQEAWLYSPFSSIQRMVELNQAEGDLQYSQEIRDMEPTERRKALREPENRVLEPDEISRTTISQQEAQDRLRQEGVSLDIPDEGITPGALDILVERKKDEIRRQDIFRRAGGGFWAGAARLGVGLGVTVLDPINAASAFIPIVGPTRYMAAVAARSSALGRASVRAQVGALEGAVGAAVVEPIVFSAAQAEQADYDLTDSMLNIAFGTVAGGGLHAGMGALSDKLGRMAMGRAAQAINDAPQKTREAFARTTVSQMADGRVVDVEMIGNFEVVGDFTPVRSVERRTRVAGEKPKVEIVGVDPEVAGEYVTVSRQIDELNVELERALADQDVDAAQAVSNITDEIDILKARLETETKRNQKKISKRIEELLEQRDRQMDLFAAKPGSRAAELKKKISDLEAKRKSLAPRAVRRAIEAEIPKLQRQFEGSDQDFLTAGKEPSFRLKKEFEVDREFEGTTRAQKTFGPDSIRYADYDAAREARARVKEHGEKDAEVLIDEETASTQEQYDKLLERTGLSDEDLSVADDFDLPAKELVDDVPTYKDGLVAAASCMQRKG